jgi:uncharacterized protein YbjQ (UPF0145 family)
MVEQTINIYRALEYVGLVMTIIIAAMVIGRNIKKGYQNYVDNKIDIMDTKITSIQREVYDNKRDNQREHDAIKEEFLSRVNMIFEWIKSKSN